MTSCTRVRGFFVKIKEGPRLARIFAARDFDSVAGTFDKGLIKTSNVASEGSSAASRTSIGPERDASAPVPP